MTDKPLEQMGLRDLRGIMRHKAPAEAWKHFNGAAETKATFHRNPRAFQQYLFRQKIFHDVSEPDISVELFGKTLPIPAITAPVGSFSLICKDAEREVAEGTDRAGAMMLVSQAAHLNLHDWRAADKSPLVFMAYMNRGREEVEDYAKTAQDLGFAAVGITMDTVKPVKIGDEVPLSTKDGKPRKGHKSTPKDIEWMKQMVKLPVAVKGIMGAADAKIAVNSGADALVVSNHGGRILDFNVRLWKRCRKWSMPSALKFQCSSTVAFVAAAISSRRWRWVPKRCSSAGRWLGASALLARVASSECLIFSPKRCSACW